MNLCLYILEFPESLWISCLQFFEEMFFFVLDLPLSDKQWLNLKFPINFSSIKCVSPVCCLLVDLGEISINRIDWFFTCFESEELRMIRISFCLSFEYMLCEKRFSPEGYESFCIEVLRMERPDSHNYLIREERMGTSFLTSVFS